MEYRSKRMFPAAIVPSLIAIDSYKPSAWCYSDKQAYKRSDYLIKNGDFVPILYQYNPKKQYLPSGLYTIARHDFRDYDEIALRLDEDKVVRLKIGRNLLPRFLRETIEDKRLICLQMRYESNDLHGDNRKIWDEFVIGTISRLFFDFSGASFFFVGGYYKICVHYNDDGSGEYYVSYNGKRLGEVLPCEYIAREKEGDFINFIDNSRLVQLESSIHRDINLK